MSFFHAHIRTTIDIGVMPERVWRILVDFARYPQWNVTFRFADGHMRVGERLDVKVLSGNLRETRVRPVLLRAEESRELRWRGSLLLPGILDGEHIFELVPSGEGGTRFNHSEIFSGILVSMLRRELDTNTRRAFESFNRALKRRAEDDSSPGESPRESF